MFKIKTEIGCNIKVNAMKENNSIKFSKLL